MKIERKLVPEMTLSEFADAQGLTMEVGERPKRIGQPSRFFASFRGAEVMGDGVLTSAYGDGASEEDAIRAYGAEISETRIVIGAYTPDRREIVVPRIIEP